MFVIRVAPITKGVSKEELTYFSGHPFSPGEIVKVPLRNKEVSALVLKREDAKENRAELRNADFSLRKIKNTSSGYICDEAFINASSLTAESIASNTGAILNSLIPKYILDEHTPLSTLPKNGLHKTSHSIEILQTNTSDRITHYKNSVRESFVQKQSVFICMPQKEGVEKMYEATHKGLAPYVYMLHSGIGKKKILEYWDEIVSSSHPVVIIATPQFLSIPRSDIATYILEEEQSPSYKMQIKPYLDVRLFIEHLAKERNARLVLGDTILQIETLYRYKEGLISHLHPPKFKYPSGPRTRVVDMSTYKNPIGKKRFELFSDEVRFIIEKKVVEKKENLFLFVGRKGLYPLTVCADCGEYVVCKKCGTPTTVQNYHSSRLFVCNACGTTRPTEERCANCHSWKLQALGIGVDLIYEEIQKMYPNISTFLIDKASTPTPKKARSIWNEFKQKDGSILVGTHQALGYIEEVDNSAIISIDALFSVPDFRMSEKIFSLILSIRSKTRERMVIQIRNADRDLIEYAHKGNIADFYKEEITLRKQFSFPPFTRFIKLTLIAPYTHIEKEVESMKNLFKGLSLELFPALSTSASNKRALNIIIRITKNEESVVFPILKTLPPWVRVEVDPLTLL